MINRPATLLLSTSISDFRASLYSTGSEIMQHTNESATATGDRSLNKQESLALASMARDDPHASSTAAAMRGKVGSEFET